MEEDADDDMYQFAVHLKARDNSRASPVNLFYAKVLHRRTHIPAENSAFNFAVKSCNLAPMVLAATV